MASEPKEPTNIHEAGRRPIRWLSTRIVSLRRCSEQRAFLVIASLLVCAYALSVLFYVLSTPELGVRCAFSPVVNHFYPEFSYLKNSGHLWEGDRIVQVADQRIVEWSQLLHKLKDLQKDLLPAIDEKRAAELTQGV